MIKRIGVWMCIAAMLLCGGVSAFAAERIDPSRKGQLTVEYNDSETALSGVEFAMYYVAEVSDRGVYTLRGSFAEYPVVINGLDSEGMRAAASTLSMYADKDQIDPDARRTTDASGRFVCEDLDLGLYLFVGAQHTQDGYLYLCEPTLVYLPGTDTVSGALIYEVTAAPKAEKKPAPLDTVTRKILKTWKDDGENNRPRSVVVHLLRDGEIFETVTLSEENNWRCVFRGLDGKREWGVVEEVPAGYTVTVTKEGTTFLVTNTEIGYPHDPDGPNDPDDPDDPGGSDDPDDPDGPDGPNDPDDPDAPGGPNDPDDPDAPGGSDDPDDPDAPGGSDDPDDPDMPGGSGVPDEPGTPALPQTGQFWWPVPLLAFGGMMLFVLGYMMRRKENTYEEQ